MWRLQIKSLRKDSRSSEDAKTNIRKETDLYKILVPSHFPMKEETVLAGCRADSLFPSR